MSAAAGGAAAGATAAAAIANAIKASGAIVKMEPDQFSRIINRDDRPLVVVARGGWLNRKYRYLAGYKGLMFYAESDQPLQLSGRVEVVSAKKIWIPG